MGKYEDLQSLENLRERGAITEEEFQREKAKILGGNNDKMLGMNQNGYLVLMHLSQFAGFILPGLGFAAPIILWLINRDNNAEVDQHGKNIANFLISMTIYIIIAIVLCIVLIGIPLLIILGILEIIFIIVATARASKGEYWKYPISITFFS